MQEMSFSTVADEILMGGAAGPGKTAAMVVRPLRQVGIPGFTAICFRRNFRELRDATLPEARRIYDTLYEGRPDKPTFHKSDYMWEWPNGSRVIYSHMENEGDEHQHKSAQYDEIYFDELTQFHEDQYLFMLSRLRGVNPAIRRSVCSATNPGGIGHAWVLKRFLRQSPWELIGYRYTDPNTGTKYVKTRIFLPGRVYDNPHWTTSDPGYIANLLQLPEAARKALLDGDWTSFEGQFFREWSPARHVIEPQPIPIGAVRYMSIDWGYSHDKAVCGWYAVLPTGRVWKYREFVRTGMLASDFARTVIGMSAHDGPIECVYGDPSMWNKTGLDGAHGESIAETMQKVGLRLVKADNSRASGWMRMHEMLGPMRDGMPGLQFFRTCTYSIDSIPKCIHDVRKPEDLDTHGDDHAADETRYFVMGRPQAVGSEDYAEMVRAAKTHYEDDKTRLYWESQRRRMDDNFRRRNGQGGSHEEIARI